MKRIFQIALNEVDRLGREEQGVAFVVTLGAFMFMYMLCCGVYAVGDTVRQKIELQNAVDAASYSAAVIQADTLSRIATINRAMAWTYVQMSRRQLDFITDKWLERTIQVWDEDFRDAKKWHSHSVFISPWGSGCNHNHKNQQADTYWVGVDENHHGWIHLNGLSSVFNGVIPGLSSLNSLGLSAITGLGQEEKVETLRNARKRWKLYTILENYNSGNPIAILDVGTQILVDKLNINAMNLAEMDLVVQMPQRIEETILDVLMANLPANSISRGDFDYFITQSKTPYEYFRLLRNTKEDEKIFLSFAEYYDNIYSAFRGSPSPLGAGIDWGAQAKLKAADLIGTVSGGVDRWFVRGNGKRRANDSDIGIQRSYKMWSEDVLASLHPSKYMPILPPTALNFNKDDNSPSRITNFSVGRGQAFPSIGLYSEWRWYSMIWFCVWTPSLFHPSRHSHQEILSMFNCNHASFDLKVKYNKNCIVLPLIKDGLKVGGYTRVYGDDPVILAQHREKYTGARCNPLLLSPSFFGKPGAIIVGLSKKNYNPWSLIMEAAGIFEAFNPGISHMWAFSAARAGYKPVGGGTGEYHIGWSDPTDNKMRWNLKQPDWDAVFLPVRDAWKFCSDLIFLEGFFANDDSILTELISANANNKNAWNSVKAPRGMRTKNSNSNLDWKGLSKRLLH